MNFGLSLHLIEKLSNQKAKRIIKNYNRTFMTPFASTNTLELFKF